MTIELPPLPFGVDALTPYMSRRTLEVHYGKHHKAFVEATKAAIAGTDLEQAELPEVIRAAKARNDKKLFNSAAQAWNHTFFWRSLSPAGGGEPFGLLAEWIQRDFGGLAGLDEAFTVAAAGHFGSGWVWLVAKSGKLLVTATHDAETPVVQNDVTPLLTCDIWEHAYYLDYQNQRATFIEKFLDKLINWDFADINLRKCTATASGETSFLRSVFSMASSGQRR